MRWCLVLFCLLASFSTAAAEDGLLEKESLHSVETTIERFEDAARAKGIKLFPKFDHAAAAEEYGETMRPSVVLSFGNPKYGTRFMVERPQAGIDFPPKAIVYEDNEGRVWIAYNSAPYLYDTIFQRHGLQYPESDIAFFANVLEELTDHAVGRE